MEYYQIVVVFNIEYSYNQIELKLISLKPK